MCGVIPASPPYNNYSKGSYKVRGIYKNIEGTIGGKKVWTGRITSNEVMLRID